MQLLQLTQKAVEEKNAGGGKIAVERRSSHHDCRSKKGGGPRLREREVFDQPLSSVFLLFGYSYMAAPTAWAMIN